TAYDGFTQANPLPYAQEWNFGVQHLLAKELIAEINYVGSRGVHLAVNLPTNTVPYDPALDTAVARANTTSATQQVRPFPKIGSFNSLNMEGVSSYHALQAGIRRQYGDNLTFLANYTFSKSIDDATGTFAFSQPSGLNLGQFPNQFLSINKGLSEFDRTHSLTAALQFKTKGNRWVRNVEFYPIFMARSGMPFYIGQTNANPAQTGTNQQRPNYLYPTVSLYAGMVPNGTGIQYLVPVSAPYFPLGPTGPFFIGSNRQQVLPAGIGNLGRNVVRGPGEFDLDLSVGRAFDLTEKLKFTIRGEAYNALNHTNFQAPSSTTSTFITLNSNPGGQPFWNSPSFGLITAANQSRFLQLAARFDF
ncbi:MAG: TonB-dependent receptor, partial [Acidobacteriaceae bacterium]|nr:TonB-dependent receptor [Acidobacteriaceae bacterium]